ncbi:MAG: hypothetical protein RI994_1954 [Pseudomonadota bacterium]|jgi:hypothetical protein
MAFNANAADAPKADDKKKPERSAVPERITRPKATPESLPQPLEKKSVLEVCPKYEYKERDSKIVCLIKPAGGEKPKPAAK